MQANLELRLLRVSSGRLTTHIILEQGLSFRTTKTKKTPGLRFRTTKTKTPGILTIKSKSASVRILPAVPE